MSIPTAQDAPRFAAGVSRRSFAGFALGGAAALALGRHGRASAQDASPEAAPSVGGNLTVYCGRNEALIGGLLDGIQAATGVSLDVRYGNTAELAAQIMEEGSNSPAGLYFSQDAGALGALAKAERLMALPDDVLASVDERFHDAEGRWIGLSGRARVLVFNPDETDEAALPESILDLPESDLGPIGLAPTNASFQTFVTALRLTEGEDGAREWLEAVRAADHVIFDGNGPIVDAVASGEVAVGLVNHYYLYQKQKENPNITAQNHYFLNGDIGGLINIAGVGVLADSGQDEQALAVTRYLLSDEAQSYFAEETSEYPLASGVSPSNELPPLDEYKTPDVDLNDLDDLQGTLMLLTDLGLI